MPNLTIDLKLLVDTAQILTAIITLLGVITAFWISRKTLREIQNDRIISQRPFLLFEYGGNKTSIKFCIAQDGKEYIQAYWPVINEKGGIHVPTIGKLKNLGVGPAIDVRITWFVEQVYIKGEKFKIDEEKRKEIQYQPAQNTNPIITSHLFPNQESGFHLIPYFISADFEKKIERADGVLIIKYFDTYENSYETYQKFHAFTEYSEKKFHTTFSDLIEQKNYTDNKKKKQNERIRNQIL
jgi:hypothetical protein